MTFVIKSIMDPYNPPDILGFIPVVAKSQEVDEDVSEIPKGALVVVKEDSEYDLAAGDIVAFFDDKYSSSSSTDARYNMLFGEVENVTTGTNGNTYEIDKYGDNTSSVLSISSESVAGSLAFCVPFLGALLAFVQEPIGIVVCIGIPLLVFLIYDIVRRRLDNNDFEEDVAEEPVANTSSDETDKIPVAASAELDSD